MEETVQFISTAKQTHSMNFHVGQEWFLWSGAILAQRSISFPRPNEEARWER